MHVKVISTKKERKSKISSKKEEKFPFFMSTFKYTGERESSLKIVKKELRKLAKE
jgi:hypothetical protein